MARYQRLKRSNRVRSCHPTFAAHGVPVPFRLSPSPRKEKATGHFSTRFRGPSSSPLHRLETGLTSKTLNIVVTIDERSSLSPQNMTMLFTACQRHTLIGSGSPP
jgi:hypothetical protein